MKRTIEELGVTFDTEFEAAAAEDVSLDEDGTAHLYTRVDPKPTGFDEHFKGVPTQYRYSVRITAHRETPALRIHVHTDRELGGWYIQFGGFVKRGGEWAPIPLEHATNVPETSDVLVTLSLREGESVLLASMPFIAPSEMETQLAALERTEGHNWSTRVLGETAKGRKIWALETAPRAKRIVMAGTSQGAEPVAERLVELARRLTVDLTDSRWLLDNYQVCLVPMINPDGAAEGHSLLNGIGEVVAGGYKAAVAGEPCPVESKALADYVGLAPTQAYLEFHAHYRTIPPGEEDHLGVRKQHLLNPGMADIYPAGNGPRLRRALQCGHAPAARHAQRPPPHRPMVETGSVLYDQPRAAPPQLHVLCRAVVELRSSSHHSLGRTLPLRRGRGNRNRQRRALMA